jgi:hypothetical protein
VIALPPLPAALVRVTVIDRADLEVAVIVGEVGTVVTAKEVTAGVHCAYKVVVRVSK